MVAQGGQGWRQGCWRRADSGQRGRDRGAVWLSGCLAAWASVDVGVGVDVGDGGTELAVFPVRGDDGAVSDKNN